MDLDFNTFVISLPQAVKRRANLKKILQDNHIDQYEFFDATYGAALLPDQIKPIFSSSIRWAGHPNVYGCAFSHVRLWQKMVETVSDQKNQSGMALILEDDVVLEDNFLDRLKKNIQSLQKNSDWDMLYLGGIQCQSDDNISFLLKCLQLSPFSNFGKQKCTWISKDVYQPRVILGTHAYLLNVKGARKLLDSLLGRIYTHIDYMVMTVPNLNYYACSPFLAHQRVTLEASGIASPTQFPFFMNRKLDGILQHESGVSWGYFTTTPVSQFSGECVNLWTAIFFLIGMMLYYYFKSPGYIVLACLCWFAADIIIEGIFYHNFHLDLRSMRSMLFSFLVVLSPAMLY